MPEAPDDIMAGLVRYMSDARDKPLPTEVAQEAKHHVLDTLAAMVSGSRLPPGKLAIGYGEHLGGRPDALLIGTELLSSAVNAAVVNGITAHADETDDSYEPALMHPGCAIIPAAWGLAERENIGGESLLRAVALGYDIGSRVILCLGTQTLRDHLLDSHAFGGCFGAAAASASVLGMNAGQMRHVLSLAAQQASGLANYPFDLEHREKAFLFGGMPARNGVTAATLVEAGFTGQVDVFFGRRSFLEAFSPEPHPEELVAGLGERFAIARTNIKRFCVGSPIQAALDSLTSIQEEHGITAEEVDKLVVRLPESGAATVNNQQMPDVNVQHCLALTLVDGAISFESCHSYERMADPKVLEVKSRIELVPDPELTIARPPRQAIVEIDTRDGRRLVKRTTAVSGTADNPMTTQEVEAKAMDLMGSVLGQERARKLVEAVWNLDSLPSIRDLQPLLKA